MHHTAVFAFIAHKSIVCTMSEESSGSFDIHYGTVVWKDDGKATRYTGPAGPRVILPVPSAVIFRAPRKQEPLPKIPPKEYGEIKFGWGGVSPTHAPKSRTK